MSAWDAIDNGVVAQTTRDRKKYWSHWSRYAAAFRCNEFLTDVSPIERDIIVTAFAARVKSGFYGRGNPVKVKTVTDALSAISKTIELAGPHFVFPFHLRRRSIKSFSF